MISQIIGYSSVKATLRARTTFVFAEFFKLSLPDYIRQEDSYKDANLEGFVVRFLKIFGHELNQEYYNKIQDLENEWSPLTLTKSSFLDYIAFALGDIPNFAKDEAAYRRLLTFVVSIYKVKGRELSFKSILYPALIKVLGVDDVELAAVNYDEPDVNYDEDFEYDENCATCSEYDLLMSSALPLTAELYNKILSLIALVEPINADLRNFVYNGETVTTVHIEVVVDENGDLIYNNDEDPDLVLTLTPDGDLVVSGPNAARYFINDNGDLMWISY